MRYVKRMYHLEIEPPYTISSKPLPLLSAPIALIRAQLPYKRYEVKADLIVTKAPQLRYGSALQSGRGRRCTRP